VSSIDNVIKAYVLHGHSQLHPLFALLSVLGGVHVFGPIGILVGPMVVVFLQTLLEILNHELGTDSVESELDQQSAETQKPGEDELADQQEWVPATDGGSP
jgi:predicted PurR-regulated permease PerM